MNDDSGKAFSVAVFPFLKTTRAVELGGIIFRSTQEVDHLPAKQANSVTEIANMLFLKDDLKIANASYAIVPFVDINNPSTIVDHLINIQAIVAFFYASPHETFGDPFLDSEYVSMAIFSPGQVPATLVRPDFNVIVTEDQSELTTTGMGLVSGYSGLYNFQHHFWVAPGSRLYGPKPHLTLNISQNLSSLLQFKLPSSQHPQYYTLLLELLNESKSAIASRIFTAIRWYNSANREANDDNASLVNLAIAFESLLGLPISNKSERLVDAIALLLGRLPRLDVWARQFYEARSEIVHEGQTHRLYFVASDSQKGREDDETYQPLLSYGRQVFRLCLGTILTGSTLAKNAKLEEKLVTNHQRFVIICKTLGDDNIDPCERLSQIKSIVDTISRYRFLPESNLRIKTLIGATRLAVKILLECNGTLPQEVQEKINALISAKGTDNHLDELEAIRELEKILDDNEALIGEFQHGTIIHKLVQVVWGYVYVVYFWLHEQHS